MRQNPYASFLDDVEKPARYIGGEHFIVRKNWDEVQGRVCLAFPDTYEIGMSHLGFKILYEELNRYPHLLVERVFTPWVDMEKLIREKNLPLVTLENFKVLNEFDIVGFSLQYEMSYSNILTMLDLGGITLWQKDRKEEEPFVICGGPCATHPEPLAPFMDFVVIGDGEDLIVRLATFIGEARQQKKKRKDILRELANWKGIYVPCFYKTSIDEKTELEVVSDVLEEGIPLKIERFFVQDLKNYPFPTKSPIPHMTAIFDRFSVELSRGCTEGCRFCQAGMIYRPVRERAPEKVIETMIEGIKNGGFEEASLTCLSTADYTAITPLILDLVDKMQAEKATLGISSLRAYGLDLRVFDKLAEVKNSSLTFAPEAGTERMRKVINKNITEEDMLKTAGDVFSRGWVKMKLYFMIGLPTETDEDVIGIMETGAKARRIARQNGVGSPTITVSVSSFVPKPHTPFQWCSMIPLSEIVRKQEMLYKLSRDYRLDFRKHVSKISHLECIVSRGDRRVADLIYGAWKKGARFDGWNETFKYDLWIQTIEELGFKIEPYLGTIRMDGKLPWSHIDVGLTDRFLEIEWKKALADRSSPACGKPVGYHVHDTNVEAHNRSFEEQKKKLVCFNCGIKCDLQGMISERKEFLTSMQAFKDELYVKPEFKTITERREKRGQNIGFRYRINFSKIGALSFISHLDLQKIVARIFKRAQIEVLYSEGFHERPLFSFGPALSLGISSLSEYFDVRVPVQFADPHALLSILQKYSEAGIYFNKIEEISASSPSIQEAAYAFEFFIPVNNPEKVEEALNVIEKAPQILIKRFSPKKNTYEERDIKPFLGKLTKTCFNMAEPMASLIHEVSPCLNKTGILLTSKVEEGTGVRPSEIREFFESLGLVTEKPIKMDVLIHKAS